MTHVHACTHKRAVVCELCLSLFLSLENKVFERERERKINREDKRRLRVDDCSQCFCLLLRTYWKGLM